MLKLHRYKWITNINLRIQFLLVEKFAILLWQDYSWITVSILNNHEKRGNVSFKRRQKFPYYAFQRTQFNFQISQTSFSQIDQNGTPLEAVASNIMNFCVSNCSVLIHTTKLFSLRNIRFWNLQPGKLTNKVLRFVQKDRECFLLRR